MKVAALFAAKEVGIELNRSFIERFKDRVTITANFTVDAVASVPNSKQFDGDLHMAGRAPEIGLTVVLEIANAASHVRATNLIHHAADNGKPLLVAGVWRIWPEHGGGEGEVQEDSVAPAATPFADHFFEIHPATRIQNIDLLDSFTPVGGYRPGSARRTLGIFEKATVRLRVTPKTIGLVAQHGLYNDVHFIMEVAEDTQVVVPDGRFVMASARELTGELVVERLRMVFVKGTPPERAVRGLKRGDRLHVWGLPRVNFAEVARRAAKMEGTGEVEGSLPYEIIVVGVYDR